jgi:hypothetical protein
MNRLLLATVATLLAASLHASADLNIKNTLSVSTVKAGSRLAVFYELRNTGPDKAVNNVVRFTVSGATADRDCTAGCPVIDIPAGAGTSFEEHLTVPSVPGTITMTASFAGGVSDPNLGDNTQTTTVTVSTDPDIYISANLPHQLELGQPFDLSIHLGNTANSPAHDVAAAIEFRPDAIVDMVPDGCVSPIPGQIFCHTDTVVKGAPIEPVWVAKLIAPATFGNGLLAVSALVSESEQDFDQASNYSTASAQLADTFYVTASGNDGSGSLRQAILEANAACTGGTPCTIAFRLTEPRHAGPWDTIAITTPLPVLTAANIRIDGSTQTSFIGDTNVNGPEVEISGGGKVDGDGLLLSGCDVQVMNLVVNGFGRNGISASRPACGGVTSTELHHLFIGTDPTGTQARPNGQRGIGITQANSTNFNNAFQSVIIIHDCVISGNTLSGIFDLVGRANIWGNRIGVKAHSDDPLPNGASGIFIGPGGFGSAIGFDLLSRTNPGNVIAFNGEMGVAVAAGVTDVSILGNRIWGNKLLGIDIGLDGPTATTKADSNEVLTAPTLTLAHYDPVSKHTMIEADAATGGTISFFANDSVDPSGYGEGQRPLGDTSLAPFLKGTHFHFEVDGDLTGQFIAATSTRVNYIGFAKPGGVITPQGIEQGFLTQTSEFCRAIEVR